LHFDNALHGRIFSALGTLIARGETANPVTLGPLFEQDPALSQIGGAKYLAQLVTGAVTVTNARDYASHVADLWRRRSIVAACEDAARAAAEIDLTRRADQIAGEFATRIAEFARGPDAFETEPIDAGDDEEMIPPRGWLLGTTFCRGFISGLIAQGGAGKTAVRIAQAIALASGRPITDEHVFVRSRVLIVCLEDNLAELRRRVRAARMHHGISRDDIREYLYMWSPLGHKLARLADEGREVIAGELERELRTFIVRRRIDLVMIDPLIKAHSVEENDNGGMDQVTVILGRIAADMDCAIDLLVHERKGPTTAGDANRARGASSLKDAGRLIYTVTPMSDEEREQFGLSESERRSLLRVDSAKINIAPPSIEARWFRLVGIRLGNSTDLYPRGDEVPTAEPWKPPDIWGSLTNTVTNQILDAIQAGPSEGRRYTDANRAGDRAAWRAVAERCPSLNEKQARKVITTWLKSGMIEARDYDDRIDRKPRSGLFVLKRPG